MKALAILFLLVAAGCASSNAIIDSELVDCAEMGNEVSVALYGAEVEATGMRGNDFDLPITLQLEVSNNSQEDIVVKSISIHPTEPGRRLQVNPASGKFDETIAEGKEHVFTLRTSGRRQRSINDVDDRVSGSVPVETRVVLSNGQTYRCRFEMPLH